MSSLFSGDPMQIITSPSKTQQFNGREYRQYSLPRLQKKTKPLIDLLKKMNRKELADLLKTSEKLTHATYRKIQGFTTKLTLQNANQACLPTRETPIALSPPIAIPMTNWIMPRSISSFFQHCTGFSGLSISSSHIAWT